VVAGVVDGPAAVDGGLDGGASDVGVLDGGGLVAPVVSDEDPDVEVEVARDVDDDEPAVVLERDGRVGIVERVVPRSPLVGVSKPGKYVALGSVA
jgi:hypothetical protein